MRYATVNNWRKFQHYLDRRPPWIKLHRDILDKPEFMDLSLASRSLLMLIWLLASESEVPGRVRIDLTYLSFRLRSRIKEEDLEPLIGEFLTLDASNTLAEGSQVAIPETEGEGERETEGETEGEQRQRPASKVLAKVFVPPTLDEVKAFFASKGVNGNEYIKFMGYWDSIDWYRSKGRRLVRWKGAAVEWMTHNRERSAQ